MALDLCMCITRVVLPRQTDTDKDAARIRRGSIIKTYTWDQTTGQTSGNDHFFEASDNSKGLWATWNSSTSTYTRVEDVSASPRLAWVFAYNVFNASNPKLLKLTEQRIDETIEVDPDHPSYQDRYNKILRRTWRLDISSLPIPQRNELLDTNQLTRSWTNLKSRIYVLKNDGTNDRNIEDSDVG